MKVKPIVSALAGLVMAFPFAAAAQSADEGAVSAPSKPVKLMTADAGRQLIERQFFGQVAAKETVDLAFQVSGQVFELPVNEGEFVAEGAVIAQLDLELFELQLEQARLNKEQADRTSERNERLSGTVSQVTIEDAETAASLAGVSVRNAERDLNNATLHAPFDALIARREVAQFSTVSAGTPIVRIHDMSELHIEIDVPELLFQTAGEDDQLTLVAVFPGSDIEYPVEILEYAAEASAVGQTFRVTLRMEPPEDRQILPGASTTVKVKVDTGARDIILPVTAIVPNASGDTGVMAFSPAGGQPGADEGTVNWVAVEMEPNQFGSFFITSGLEDGQEVVATGGGALKAGQKVSRFTGFNN